MRAHITALTCAVAVAGAFGIASAAQQTTKTDTTMARSDPGTTTFSGCLERNNYDQYVLVPSAGAPRDGRNAAGTSLAPGSATASASSTRYELLLQKDLNLTQDVGKRVQVTGHKLQGQELRTDVGNAGDHAGDKPVGTSGNASATGAIVGVVGVQQIAGACAPETPRR